MKGLIPGVSLCSCKLTSGELLALCRAQKSFKSNAVRPSFWNITKHIRSISTGTTTLKTRVLAHTNKALGSFERLRLYRFKSKIRSMHLYKIQSRSPNCSYKHKLRSQGIIFETQWKESNLGAHDEWWLYSKLSNADDSTIFRLIMTVRSIGCLISCYLATNLYSSYIQNGMIYIVYTRIRWGNRGGLRHDNQSHFIYIVRSGTPV